MVSLQIPIESNEFVRWVFTSTLTSLRVVIDFTLVDFQAMFKFIDIEEVRGITRGVE